MYDLVIFDFDDTLLHLNVRWHNVREEVVALARRDGLDVDPHQHLVPLGNMLARSPERKKTIDRIYRMHELGCVSEQGYEPFPDMLRLVRELRSRGKKLAIASGNHTDTLKAVLARLGITDSFDIVCGRDAVDNNKPEPDQLLLIMERLGAGKGSTLFVGDSPNDELAARAAGIAFFRTGRDHGSDARMILLMA
ncbi:MAG: HAD family hydrolase [Candidatus Micrarchaeia archaeon]